MRAQTRKAWMYLGALCTLHAGLVEAILPLDAHLEPLNVWQVRDALCQGLRQGLERQTPPPQHDAACAHQELKAGYDAMRPIAMMRAGA